MSVSDNIRMILMQCVNAISKHDKLLAIRFRNEDARISLNFSKIKQIILILEIYCAFGLVNFKWHSFIYCTPLVWCGSESNSQPTGPNVDALRLELRLQPLACGLFHIWMSVIFLCFSTVSLTGLFLCYDKLSKLKECM